jgi:hypothetical protein
VEANLGEHGEHLLRNAFVPVVAGPLFRLPVAFEVDGDAVVGAGQSGHLVAPLEPTIGDAVEEENNLRSGFAGFDVVPAYLLVVARRLDKVVCKSHSIKNLSVAVFVWLTRLDGSEVGGSFVDALLRWNGTANGLLSPLVEGRVLGRRHDGG